jgi:hypothetical protein
MTKPSADRVQKLHLVGYTTDHDGLILSARRGARSGGYVLEVDASVAEAVDAYRAKQAELGASRNGKADREESRLAISEIQARLRRGKSIKDVAKDAGVSPEWVERFAAPVFAERARIVDHVKNASLRRPRLGTSSLRVGDAIRANLAERGVAISVAEFDEAWTSQQMPNGKWTVRFKVRYRGAEKTLRFDLKGIGSEIVAHDQLTQQLSYVAPPVRKTPAKAPAAPAPSSDDEGKKRAQVSTGFRPDPVVKPVSRPAKERERAAREMNKAAARRGAESEKAAARKARERAQALAKREREAQADAARREKAALARTKAAASAARAAAVEAARREREEAAAAAARKAERDRVREAARQKAIKAVRTRPAAKATPAKKSAPKAADQARTAAAVRKRTAAAEEAARSRAAKPRVPTPTTEAKRAAADPTTPPAKAAAKKAAAPAKSAATAAKPARTPSKRTSEPRPTAAARVDPARLAGAGAAVEAYGPEATRALFRAGLAEPAASVEVDDTAETPRPEIAPERRSRPEVRLMGRRRRRQLRAD